MCAMTEAPSKAKSDLSFETSEFDSNRNVLKLGTEDGSVSSKSSLEKSMSLPHEERTSLVSMAVSASASLPSSMAMMGSSSSSESERRISGSLS